MRRYSGRQLFFIGLVAAAVVAGVAAYRYAVDSPLRISAAEAKRRIAAREVDVVLDVRTDFERRTLGAYPGSLHIPSGDLEKRLGELPKKDARILLYCNTGQRARAAADKLVGAGYTNVHYIATPHTSIM